MEGRGVYLPTYIAWAGLYDRDAPFGFVENQLGPRGAVFLADVVCA